MMKLCVHAKKYYIIKESALTAKLETSSVKSMAQSTRYFSEVICCSKLATSSTEQLIGKPRNKVRTMGRNDDSIRSSPSESRALKNKIDS